MMRKYNIIIPTKDRFETLKWTIESCLNINFPNYQIIISDNCSEDETASWIQKLNNPKIKYYRTPHKMGMTANWEYALSKVEEGMVTILGDDDAFMPDSLDLIENLLNEYQLDAISWKQSFYRWPNNEFVKIKNLLSIPSSRGVEIRKCSEMLQKVLDLEFYPADLPWLYAGFVDYKYIKEIKQRSGGQFFHSKIPDIYSSMVLSSVIDKYLYSYLPLSIAGHSAKSNGAAQIQNSEAVTSQNKNFIKESESHPFHPSLEFVHVYPILIWETYIQAKEHGVMRSDINLNKQFMLDRAILDCIRLDFISRDIEKLRVISQKHQIELNIPTNKYFLWVKRKWSNGLNYLSIWTNNLFVACKEYDISNVHEASKSYRSLEWRSRSKWNIIFNNLKVLLTN